MSELVVRKILESELGQLLSLYRHLNPNDPSLHEDELAQHWKDILSNPLLHYMVAEMDSHLVSSCTLTIIPNLTRAARPYGLIENVVTDSAYRKRGIGTQVLKASLRLAWERKCYKVMLMTGSKDPATLRFYEQAGFSAGDKTAFIARSK